MHLNVEDGVGEWKYDTLNPDALASLNSTLTLISSN